MSQRAGSRVLGPYRQHNGWRVVLLRPDGSRASKLLKSEEDARRFRAATERALDREVGRPVDEAIVKYRDHLVDKGNKLRSVDRTEERLRLLFPAGERLDDLTVARANTLYEQLRSRVSLRTGKAYSVSTCHSTIIEARTFIGWCQKNGWIRANPLTQVELVGRVGKGKPQLRVDEARKLLALSLSRADSGDPGAVAALVALLLALRSGEIVGLRVRDVDDEGRLLWVDGTKTVAARRAVGVPDMLRPHLLRLAEGRAPGDLLFGKHWRDWPRHCVQALCEAAGVPVVSAHGLRGTHATLAIRAGLSPFWVAQALGHESPAMTTGGAYADPGSAESERAARVAERLDPRRAK